MAVNSLTVARSVSLPFCAYETKLSNNCTTLTHWCPARSAKARAIVFFPEVRASPGGAATGAPARTGTGWPWSISAGNRPEIEVLLEALGCRKILR